MCQSAYPRGTAYGLIDSGADITIIGGSLFKKVATVARLKKKNFKKADRVPRTYDQQPFRLDGRMDLDVAFGGTQMTTPVYIKVDAHDQLLLSEGVCRQLGILQYDPDVETWRGGRKKSTPATNKPNHRQKRLRPHHCQPRRLPVRRKLKSQLFVLTVYNLSSPTRA